MKILIIEDEQTLANSMAEYLTSEKYVTEWAKSYQDATEKLHLYNYDCILLDIMLPDGNGLQLLKEIKMQHSNAGIIIISAKDALEDKLQGLTQGADDYLAKPFHLPELAARMYALIRRRQFDNQNLLQSHELQIDLIAKKVLVNAHEVALTKTEFDLLLFLIGNKNRVISKSAMAEHISGDRADLFTSHDVIYAHVKNLKRKLGEAGCDDHIKTAYGMGYKWEA